MNSLDNIKQNFEQNYPESIQLLLQKRKSIKLRFTLRLLIIVALMIANVYYFNEAKYFVGIFIIFFGFINLQKKYYLLKAEYEQLFRENIISKLTPLIDNQLQYYPEYGISKEAFKNSGITTEKIDRYQSNDYFEGEIDGASIRFAEVIAESKDTSSEGVGYNTIFQGIYFQADFPKNFKSRTVIFPDILNGKMKFIGNFLAKHSIAPKNAEKVSLEDPEFNKYFVVYSQDQIEARFILTTSMMERILKFKEKHRYFSMSFADELIHIGLFSNKSFQPSLFGTLISNGLLLNYIDSIDLTVGIVQDLKMNTNIYNTNN